MPRLSFSRRSLIATVLFFCFAGTPAWAWHSTEISGVFPPLDFQMTRVSDGKLVSATDFKGKVVLLYFGYTSCPDACPTALLNMSDMLKSLGPRADDVRVLFVTVDPGRDTSELLKEYTGSFAPQVVGLRGTPDQLAGLAKRYRVSYSVERTPAGIAVTHSSAIYVFDRAGEPRLLFTGLALPNAPIEPALADLRGLVTHGPNGSWWRRLLGGL